MKLLSLFSGIGAFEKALINVGINYELVGFSEIDKWAIDSYCAIHDVDKNLNLGDVSKIDTNHHIPDDIDLITYGFPCQDISLAGKQKGITKNTRSGLLYASERIIEQNKPKYAIAENVKNLVSNKFRNDFHGLLQRLDSYGYNNYWAVLNAKSFGIPQNRERVFIVSIRKDIDDHEFKFDNIPTQTLPNIVDFLDAIPTVPVHHNRKKILLESLKKQNKITNLLVFEDRRDEGARVFKDGVVGTLRTVDSCGDKRVLRINKENDDIDFYKLSPREAFKLMGFTDVDYEKVYNLGTSNSQMYKQAGNSIVVNVLEEIFKELFQ